MRLTFVASVGLLGGCAWTPIVHEYPSGLRIVRAEASIRAKECGTGGNWDDGRPRNGRVPVGCYRASEDTIFIADNCEGARALVHELAHRDGIKDPANAGFDW